MQAAGGKDAKGGVAIGASVCWSHNSQARRKNPERLQAGREWVHRQNAKQRASLSNKLALSIEKGSFSGSHQLPQRSKKSIKSLIFTSPSPLKSGQIS